MTSVRPFGRVGRKSPMTRAGSAAATAASNIAQNSARGSGAALSGASRRSVPIVKALPESRPCGPLAAASHFFTRARNGRNSPFLVWPHRGNRAAWTRSFTMEQDRQETGTAAATQGNGSRRTRWIVAGGVAVLALAGIGAAGAMGGGDGMGRQFMEVGMRHGGH